MTNTMVNESHYWKSDLKKIHANCKKIIKSKRMSNKKINSLEIELMKGCFLIRKILEANKFSEEVESISVNSASFRSTGRKINRIDRFDFEEYFNIKQPHHKRVGIKDLTNCFIHSYVFFLASDVNRYDSTIICSDRDKAKSLYKFSIYNILDVFNRAAGDSIAKTELRKCDAAGEWVVISSKSHRQAGKVSGSLSVRLIGD